MYYGLSNFYQNHRRYVKSRDDSQLNGDMQSLTVWIHYKSNNTWLRPQEANKMHCHTAECVAGSKRFQAWTPKTLRWNFSAHRTLLLFIQRMLKPENDLPSVRILLSGGNMHSVLVRRHSALYSHRLFQYTPADLAGLCISSALQGFGFPF